MPVTPDEIDRAVAVARRYGARRVLLFGSALDAPDTARDLDLAVEGVTGWDFFRMSAEMEEAVRVPLDVIPLESPSPFVRHIQRRARVLHERG